MTDINIDQVVQTLKAIGHPSRLQILASLAEQPSLTLSALQKQLQLNGSVLSNHLSHLNEQRLLITRQHNDDVHYQLSHSSIRTLVNILRTNYF